MRKKFGKETMIEPKIEKYTLVDFSSDVERENFLRIVGYKWEFMRRNSKYISDFKKMCNPAPALNNVLGEPRKDEYKAYFRRKYNSFRPLNPKFSFKELISIKNNEGKLPPYILGGFLDLIDVDLTDIKNPASLKTSIMPIKCHHIYKSDITLKKLSDGKVCFRDLMGCEVDKKQFDPTTADFHDIVIRINLNAPKLMIDRRVKEITTLWKTKYDFYYPRTRKRKRYEEYETYLKIYDLRQQGKTYRQIAQIVYPNDYKRATEHDTRKYAIQKVTERVKNNLNACSRLIKGDYKIIR